MITYSLQPVLRAFDGIVADIHHPQTVTSIAQAGLVAMDGMIHIYNTPELAGMRLMVINFDGESAALSNVEEIVEWVEFANTRQRDFDLFALLCASFFTLIPAVSSFFHRIAYELQTREMILAFDMEFAKADDLQQMGDRLVATFPAGAAVRATTLSPISDFVVLMFAAEIRRMPQLGRLESRWLEVGWLLIKAAEERRVQEVQQWMDDYDVNFPPSIDDFNFPPNIDDWL